MIRTMRKLLRPLERGLRLAVARGTIKLVGDASKLQTVQLALLDGEVRDGVEVFQHYGFSSVPLDNAEAVAVAVGGNRDHLVVIGHGDRRSRPVAFQAGEVCIYDHQGQRIALLADGITIFGADKPITISGAPEINISGGNVNVSDADVTVTGGDVVADGISLKSHLHRDVQPGSGESGEPVG